MTTVATVATGGGVILDPPLLRKKSARAWCFTLNNYTEDEWRQCIEVFESRNYDYIIGKEECPTTGTKHLQGYFRTKKSAIRFSTAKNINKRMHLESARGTIEENYKYCSKDNNYTTNITMKKTNREKVMEKYNGVIWKDWQQEIIDIVESEPDDRTIHWYWEEQGNVGKTFLIKYLVLKYNAIVCEGKTTDVFNQINTVLKESEDKADIRLVVCNVPRTMSDYINYRALEECKDGLMYSGKYEGGVCVFPSPHVIVMANVICDRGKMSDDRWHIKKIE